MTVSNEACNELLTVEQWSRTHENSLKYFLHLNSDKKTFEMLTGSEVKVGQELAVHIQQRQTCHMVLAKFSEYKQSRPMRGFG